MTNNLKFYLGMDVSKGWVDISLLRVIDHQKQPMLSERFDNDSAGIKAMDKWLKKQKVIFNENSLMVIENTGVYHRRVWEYCSANKLPLYIGNAVHIKRSFGLVRGKNDKIDSQRLCNYAHKNADDLKASPVLDPVFMQLKDLMTSRSRLLDQINSIKVYLGELKLSNSKEIQKVLEVAHQAAIDGLKVSLKMVEKQIVQIIRENTAIRKNYDLLVSIPAIGHLTAVYLICCTCNFTNKTTGKQLASYGGMVPFGNSSGSSIKGRDKVSHMANKDLKKLFTMCALTAIRVSPEFRNYYDRKVSEGKHEQTVLNAIKSKLALRAVAVINKQESYVDNYKKTA